MCDIAENGFASIIRWKSYFQTTADRTLSENSVNLCSYYANGLVFLFWRLMLQFTQKTSMEHCGNNPPTTAIRN